jgi:hypothetical protein
MLARNSQVQPHRFFDCHRAKQRARTRAQRCILEDLEARMMPTILFKPFYGAENATDNGGLKLRNTPIYLIFEGQSWGGAPNATNGAIKQAAEGVLNSSFLIRLQQYGSDGTAYYNGEAFDNTGLPNQFSTSNLDARVQGQILQGNVPPPGSIDPIYVVVTPPGVVSNSPNAGGYHDNQFSIFFGNLHEAWVSTSLNPNGTINLDGFTQLFGRV